MSSRFSVKPSLPIRTLFALALIVIAAASAEGRTGATAILPVRRSGSAILTRFARPSPVCSPTSKRRKRVSSASSSPATRATCDAPWPRKRPSRARCGRSGDSRPTTPLSSVPCKTCNRTSTASSPPFAPPSSVSGERGAMPPWLSSRKEREARAGAIRAALDPMVEEEERLLQQRSRRFWSPRKPPPGRSFWPRSAARN